MVLEESSNFEDRMRKYLVNFEAHMRKSTDEINVRSMNPTSGIKARFEL